MPESSAAFSDDAVTASVTQPLGAGLPASVPEESPPDVAFRTAMTAMTPTTTATTSGTRLRPANGPPHSDVRFMLSRGGPTEAFSDPGRAEPRRQQPRRCRHLSLVARRDRLRDQPTQHEVDRARLCPPPGCREHPHDARPRAVP